MDSYDGIKVGDWVTSYFAGYWKVLQIKPSYVKGEIKNMLFIIKKGFTPKMKFTVALEYCDTKWCKKVSEDKLQEILTYFSQNPKNQQKFDNYVGKMHGIAKGWYIDLLEEEVKDFNEKLKSLPELFSIRHFNRFVETIGLRKHMYQSSSKAKYMLTIVTYPWLIDEETNNSPLYFLEKSIYLQPNLK